MELHALGRQLAMAYGHHDLGSEGAALQALRELGVSDQRVVAADLERLAQAAEDRAPVVLDLAGLAVHRLVADDPAAPGLDERLVAEADPSVGTWAWGNRRTASSEMPA